ncbi:MAG TPA: hypothetical protein VF635_16435 [Propionibacteriaceae bacterium]|jgi:hypothetical protein
MTSASAAAAIEPVVVLCRQRFYPLATGRPGWVSASGLLIMVGAEEARIGIGVRSALHPTRQLLAGVAQVNQSAPAGRVWLTEDRLVSRWSVVWGLTLPYAWCTPISLQRAIHTCLNYYVEYLSGLTAHFATFGGLPYWSSLLEQCGGVQAGGEALMEQIG